ncbi:hypothetical protein Avbf_12561, partial [Armadillidium vulgare]
MFKNYKKKCCIPLKQHITILSSLGPITPFIEEKFNLSKNNIESYEGLTDQKDYPCDNLYCNQSNGWIQNGVKMLHQEIIANFKLRSAYTRRLCQDPIENCFGNF